MSKPVRPGQYIVTTKRRSEPGQKRKRKQRKDHGVWRRSPMGPLDPYVRTATQVILPAAAYPARDPRRKSRFLGHIIDGSLGWATDMIHHVPLVGPLVGHPARIVCRVVRSLEDGINAVTGIAGVHLFLLALLTCAVPAQAELFPFFPKVLDVLLTDPIGTYFSWAVRQSSSGSPTTAAPTTAAPTLPPMPEVVEWNLSPLTNCCNYSQVAYCSELSCMHDTGCVICEQRGNDTRCWEPSGPMISRSPDYQGVDPFLTHHIDFVAGVIYMCDLAAMHEVCGAAVLLARVGLATVPVAIQLNETASCYLEVQSGVDPTLLGWLGWLKGELYTATALFSFVFKIPSAISYAFGTRHFVTMAAIAGLAMNGNFLKAVALTVLYVEAAVAAPVLPPQSLTNCSAFSQPSLCDWTQNWTEVACYGPKGPFLPPPVARFAHDIIGTLLANGLNSSRAYSAVTSRQAYHVGGYGCLGKLAGSPTCCALRRVPPECSSCSSDCAWLDRKLTYERCGTSPWLSTGCKYNSTTGRCVGEELAGFNLPAIIPAGARWTTTYFQEGHPVLVWYMPRSTPPYLWARLPGVPEQYRGAWMKVPEGYYSERRDLSTGLVSKDASFPDYQLFYSASGALQVVGITAHVVVVACLAALGARWCLVAYALFWFVWPTESLGVVEAATAAVGHAGWYERALVYLVCLRWSILCFFLPGSLRAFIVLCCAACVEAYSGADLAMAGASSTLLLMVGGALANFVPRLALTTSYLRRRIQLETIGLADKRVVLLGVLFAPSAVAWCCAFYWFCTLGLLAVQQFIVYALGIHSKAGFFTLIRSLTGPLNRARRLLLKLALWAGAEEGHFWYRHLHGTLDLDWKFSDPYYPFQTEVEYAKDVGHKLACGDTLKGLPIFARCGKTVAAGVACLPRRWRQTAPFSTKVTFHRRELHHLALCLTGHDGATYSGCVCIVGSPLSRWMGFGCNGVLYTAAHGSKGKHLAGEGGSHPPIVINRELDVCTYPLPKGMSCLKTGNCSCTEFYLVTRLGNIIPCVRLDGKYINTAPLTLKEAKGSSGAPILCKCRFVHAMFLKCRSSRGVVSSLTGLPISEAGFSQEPASPVGLGALPPVNKEEKQIKVLVAPTGSGKSTRVPMEYYKQGYKVLVLNPSVATTLSFEAYMFKEYNVKPNIHCGDTHHNNGSRLTYKTYGMFLAQQQLDADVIICDECHSVDATSVLGIGEALRMFESSNNAKLLILATATPPGTPIQDHPNITTVTLNDEGEIPFHGKKIPIERLTSGRHLIFQTSKRHCDELAKDLQNAGLTAVAYYRGLDVSVIPKTGDVVVVATDALMTGYTGNFDTVYDSCLAVEPTLEVTMMPSFQLGLRTKAADSVTRMQRRGRTGRGKPGTYYQVCAQCDTSGLVPDAAVYEAFDSGMAYFGRTPAEVATALDFYHNQNGLPTIQCSIAEVQAIFTTIGYVQHNYLEMMKNRVDSYTYLYAAQYQLAKAEKSQKPNDDPAWRGLDGTAKFPLLYHLQEYDNERVQAHSLAANIQACYEEYFASWPMTLSGLGLAVAAAFVAVDLFGQCALMRAWDLTGDSTAALTVTPEDTVMDEVEECTRGWDTQALTEGANRLANWLGDAVRDLGVKLGGKSQLERRLLAITPHLLAGVQYMAGLACLSEAPGVGSVLGFVGGALSPLPLNVNLFLSALGGAFATKLTTQSGAAIFGMAGALGALASTAGISKMIGQAICTYGAATASCLVILKLIDGRWPELSEWASLAVNIASPGAFIVGAASALMIAYCTRTESQVWMNRLLAMLHRGTSCEDYFVHSTTLRANIIKLLEKANLWSIFRSLADWIQRADEDVCDTPRGCWTGFLSAVGSVVRTLVEVARGVCRHLIKIPSMPLWGCRKGYSGPWKGIGLVKVTCDCGTEGTWHVEYGKARYVSSTAWCRCWWMGRVPINNTMTGIPRPAPVSWSTMAVCNGFGDYCVYERKGDDVYLTKVSAPDQVVNAGVPDLACAVAVDGAQVKPFGGVGWRDTNKYRIRYREGEKTTYQWLPLCVTKPGPLPKGLPPNPSKEALAEVDGRAAKLLSRVGLDNAAYEKDIDEVSTPSEDLCLKTMDDEARARADRFLEQDPGKLLETVLKECRGELKNLALNPKAREFTPLAFSTSYAYELDSPPSCAATDWTDATTSLSDVPESPEEGKAEAKQEAAHEGVLPSICFGDFEAAYTLDDGQGQKVVVCADVHPEPRRPPVKQRRRKVVLKAGAKPLPKSKPSDPDTYSLLSSSWETMSSGSEEACSWSYNWIVPQLVYKGFNKVKAAIHTYTFGLMRNPNLAYTTTHASVNERVKKVTIQRSREETPELRMQAHLARLRVKTLRERELTLEEALELTSNKSAKSLATGATPKDLKAGHTELVKRIYGNLENGIESPWNQVCIMPKLETFVETPEKKTHKPARIIAYPHLEMRVVEKMVLGRIGPATVKAVCGDAYGFVPPHERVTRLVSMWKSKLAPAGFTCDTVCFDSTITPADVALESSLYEAAAADESTRRRIRSLHDNLYAGGPMTMQGSEVGYRHCRASGVFTTSSSNTMTCYLKVNAAAQAAGIRSPSWLICGDDTVCIFESQGEADDKERCAKFAVAMKRMGAPQGEVPRPYYHLELLDSCSSNVSCAQVPVGCYYYMTRDPRIPLARASVEGKGYNPLGTWLGYILANYPAVWVCRLLCVKFLETLLTQDSVDKITFDWYGNNYTVPLAKIPYIIESLHTPLCWKIQQYTPREISRCAAALRDNTIRPLRYYKRVARQVYAASIQRKGVQAFLAKTLLWWVHRTPVNLDKKKVAAVKEFSPFDPYSDPECLIPSERNWTPWIVTGCSLAALIALGWYVLNPSFWILSV
nr:polyprotein [Rodent hepacivirus]